MEKRIFRRLCIIALLTLVLSTVSSLTIYYNFYKTQSERDLSSFGELIKINLEEVDDDLKYLNDIKNVDSQIRIGYFNSKGEALFDSKKDIRSLTNHMDRPEFIDAKKYGIGMESRYSTTLSKSTYYIAYNLNNENVVRISREKENIFGAFLKVLPMDILLSIVIFIFAIILSKYATRKILQPLNENAEDLENIDINEIPEIAPFMRQIKNQNKTIKKQLLEMEQNQDTISAILENMTEGIVIINKNREILIINESTSKYLGSSKNLVGRDVLELTRNAELLDSIKNAFNGEGAEGILEIENRSIKYILNSIYTRDKLTGVILLLIDETKEKRNEKIRSEFSANVSHELKTPLTSIYGFSELIKNNMVKDEKDKEEFINRIYEESKRLLVLIDDIIQISSLESNENINKTIVDLEEIVNRVVENNLQNAKNRNISIEKSGSAKINANATMMWELITNLVENAIKYNRENGFVKINISESKDYVEMKFIDSGIGISEKDQERIFERFYRADKSRSKKSGGTGLGLSIVKHIVISHNGEIKIESKENIGTTIIVKLPK
ncbi:sensor histidine kinase [Peptoniphilus stercorisuis]|uniref:histidine kinase n=1 Tax=Peptoniphilus stercorisuis TaxID=1436965 RepID=A0ABS4KEK5_9FIRM|nr:ATP-binding protein [Peptoniphilus stercorisuis]MBP2026198.1 two-component system phosphate regulon sensor histidine kinase PhoR [Peptoniphilus stercorisuis]